MEITFFTVYHLLKIDSSYWLSLHRRCSHKEALTFIRTALGKWYNHREALLIYMSLY